MKSFTASFEVRYPNFHLQVNLELPTEGTTAIFGPSGCGKTTLLRCIAGLERSPSGIFRLGKVTWQDEELGIFLPISKRPVGYVFQEPRLFPHFSIRSNLQYGLKRIPAPQRRLSFEQVVEILGIEHLLERRPSRLSGGEQQRVAIGRALLTSPALLLLDEPLSSLDLPRKQEILPFLKRLNRELGIPMIYVTHAVDEVLQLADTLVILKEGSVKAVGKIGEVFAHLSLRNMIPEQQVGAVLDTKVTAHDQTFGLSRLEFPGGSLQVPYLTRKVGEQIRIHLLAKDISIVTGQPSFQTSVLNVLPATVLEIGQSDPELPFVDIKLDIGCPVIATITRKSLSSLHLKIGDRVFAQIKAVAFGPELRF